MLVANLLDVTASHPAPVLTGPVTAVRGPIVAARVPGAAIGSVLEILRPGGISARALVTGFQEDAVFLAPLEEFSGLAPGLCVRSVSDRLRLRVPAAPGGLVLDALGVILRGDSAQPLVPVELDAPCPAALSRIPVRIPFVTGIRSIDALFPVGIGQRMALCAAPGAGKSTLLGMIARSAGVDLTVVALVGERGREVPEFIDQVLGSDGLKRAIVVVSTSDELPIRRYLALKTATAIAEYHRDRGRRVLLLADSLTRAARALRDVGLASGEVPIRQGYTSSVFTELPKLVERSGNLAHGSITALYTLLTDHDDERDPLAQEVKSLMDGHLVLHEGAAARGIRPAIDVRRSISRLGPGLLGPESAEAATVIRRIEERLYRDRELALLGGEPDPELAAALTIEPRLIEALSQGSAGECSVEESRERIGRLAADFKQLVRDRCADAERPDNP